MGPDPDRHFIQLIAQWGQLEAIKVVATPNGWVVRSGNRRVKALRHLAATQPDTWGQVRVRAVQVLPGQDNGGVVLAALSVVDNAARRDNPFSDLVAIRAMLAELGEDERKPSQRALSHISHATGMTYAKLTKRLKFLALEPRFLREAMEGRLTVTLAECICRLPEERQRELADAFDDGEEITVETVREAAEARAASASQAIAEAMAAAPVSEAQKATEQGIANWLQNKVRALIKDAGCALIGPSDFRAPDGTRYRFALAVEEVE